MNTNQKLEMDELKQRVVIEMFDRMKERLRQDQTPEGEVQVAERMIGTLKLAVESLERDSADPKIGRLIGRLQRDIRRWEKRKAECERRMRSDADG